VRSQGLGKFLSALLHIPCQLDGCSCPHAPCLTLTLTVPVTAILTVTVTVPFFSRVSRRPIFSTDDLNMDKHKFERFLHPGRYSIASIYAPTAFPPAPPGAGGEKRTKEGPRTVGAMESVHGGCTKAPPWWPRGPCGAPMRIGSS